MERTCQVYQCVLVVSVTLISFTPSHRGPKTSGFACRCVRVTDVGAVVHTELEALLRHIEVADGAVVGVVSEEEASEPSVIVASINERLNR